MEEAKTTEVDTTIQSKGSIVTGSKAFNLPTPTILSNWTKGIKWTCTGLIVSVNGSTLFTAHQASIASFILGIIILICGGIEMSVGVDPDKKK